jgi:3-phosphoshikimate 1-carboxyvinyltransferase
VDYLGEEGYPPLRIAGGSLRSGLAELDAGASSQYLSALLMAGMALPEGLSVRVLALTSTPYVELTLAAIQQLGGQVERPDEATFTVRPANFTGAGRVRVEADLSAAAYPAAAAALTGGRVRLSGIDPESRQGDRGFLEILSRMGATVGWRDGVLEVIGNGLRGIDADLSNMPDQVPTLAALAPFAVGTTTIRNVPNLRIKECDRLAAMATELGRLGAVVEERPDGLVIQGSWAEQLGSEQPGFEQPVSDPPIPEQEVEVQTYGDHRIAMSLALVGLRRPGVVIRQPGVVAKSYPDFWHDLALLCGN